MLADWLDEVAASSEPPPPLWSTVADEEVDAAVAQLNPTLRVVYVLYTVDGCSYANISSRLQIPLQTVATKIRSGARAAAPDPDRGATGHVPAGQSDAGARRRSVKRSSRLSPSARASLGLGARTPLGNGERSEPCATTCRPGGGLGAAYCAARS